MWLLQEIKKTYFQNVKWEKLLTFGIKGYNFFISLNIVASS